MEKEEVIIALDIGVYVPESKTELSAGYDVYANLNELTIIHPKQRILIPTGIRLKIPSGYEIQVRARSGLALKHGIVAFHGTVDADYHDELSILLFNTSDESYQVYTGDRIAQIVLNKVSQIEWSVIDEGEFDLLTQDTDRGGGFGSTGI